MERHQIDPANASIDEVENELIHKVYDAALDNSIWPEMIINIVDHVNRLEALPVGQRDRSSIDSINRHFDRAFAISERTVDLQEKNDVNLKVLDALSCSVTLLDAEGNKLFHSRLPDNSISNAMLEGPETNDDTSHIPNLPTRLQHCRTEGASQIWTENGQAGEAFLLLPKAEALELGFPAKAEMVLITVQLQISRALDWFAAAHDLNGSEKKLLTTFIQASDLRSTAETNEITYETARTYLKSILQKSGASSQTDLMRKLLLNPAVFVDGSKRPDRDASPVRNLMVLRDRRELEYFRLGPTDGYPVIFFDALAGSAIDVVGRPEQYLPKLEALGMQLITPCRPGGFRSTYKELESLRDLADDVSQLCATLGLTRVSLLSYSYGSNAALAVAHELPDLVERITMSSVSYMTYSHENWREMDLFFQVTNVIGRRWPTLLRRLIPFLARSIMQNIHRFADRSADRAQCEHDRAILLDHDIRERTRAMLIERTARGMDGVIEEYRINAQPYDFDVRNIETPMTLLHGEFDINNPLGGARLLAQHAPNADLHVLKGMGHHHIFVEWDWIFSAAIGQTFVVPDAL